MISVPFGPGRVTSSPRHSFCTTGMVSQVYWRRSSYFSGAMTKSVPCQPVAKEMPTRPPERLSMTDQSSTTRTGWCSGSTRLPARIWTRSVTAASAEPRTDGFG